jgi:hypothetical protein
MKRKVNKITDETRLADFYCLLPLTISGERLAVSGK